MSKLQDICRSVRVFNDHEFFQYEPYIYRRVKRGGRDVTPSAWLITKRGEKLSDRWYYNYAKAFTYDSREQSKAAFSRAVEYLRTEFKVAEVARSPFGGYGDKEYVEKRIAEIKLEAEGAGAE
jgi:hypothetical protein